MPWNSCESTRLFSRGTSNKWSCMAPLTIPSSNFIHPDQWNIVHISYNSLWGPWPASSMNNGRSVKLKNFRGGKNFITDWLHQSVSLKFRFSLPPKKVSHETHFVDRSVSFHIWINYWRHKNWHLHVFQIKMTMRIYVTELVTSCFTAKTFLNWP